MHWYTKTGDPAYEVLGLNGKLRPTTLADARKLKLVPSVTTVLSVQDKPALLTWIKNEVLEAALKYPFNSKKFHESNWKKLILDLSGEKTKQAAKRGTEIHDALEHYYTTGEYLEKDREFVEPAVKFLESTFPGAEWVAEQSFCDPMGFGGKVDLHCKCGIVLDFKTKDKTAEEFKKIRAYDDHHMQLASYAVGLEMPAARRFNLFISTREPGVLKLTESPNMQREWNMFCKLFEFWQLKNNYFPGEQYATD